MEIEILIPAIIGIVGVAVGSIISYLAQRKLMSMGWKRDLRLEALYPLITESEIIEKALGRSDIYIPQEAWEDVRKKHLQHEIEGMDTKILERIKGFYIRVDNHNISLRMLYDRMTDELRNVILSEANPDRIVTKKETEKGKPVTKKYIVVDGEMHAVKGYSVLGGLIHNLIPLILGKGEDGLLSGETQDAYIGALNQKKKLKEELCPKIPELDKLVNRMLKIFMKDGFFKSVYDERRELIGDVIRFRKELKKASKI